MNKIIVKNICKSCLTQEDGVILRDKLKNYFDKEEKVNVDFEGMDKFVTLFFNNSMGYFILNYSPEFFDKIVSVQNLSSVGESICNFSIENAIKIYNENLSQETKNKINKITEKNIIDTK